MRFCRFLWRAAARRGARSEYVAMGGHVSVSCHGHGHISSGLLALVALAWAMDGAGAMQSAAARRLAALLQHDEEQVQQQKQAAVEEERKRANAAQAAAEAKGVDPKTEKVIKYGIRKLSAWLELHGAAAGYEEAMGPTVEVMKAFSSHCFVNRTRYSVLGNEGLSKSFGALQLPYLVPKYGFPKLKLPGWVGLDDEALDTKAAPYKIALRAHWQKLVTGHVLTEQEKVAEEQQRSLVKVKWDDRAMSLAQDQCMRDVLRRNRAATRLSVQAFVRATTSRSGGFTRDWADRSGACLQWLGRNVLSVYDFALDGADMSIVMPDESVLVDATEARARGGEGHTWGFTYPAPPGDSCGCVKPQVGQPLAL